MNLVPDDVFAPHLALRDALAGATTPDTFDAALAAARKVATDARSSSAGPEQLLVGIESIRVIDNRKSFPNDRADVYAIALVTSDEQGPVVVVQPQGVFNDVEDGDTLPIAPSWTISRSLDRAPPFVDVQIVVFRSKQKERALASAIRDALDSDKGKTLVAAIQAAAKGTVAGVLTSIASELLSFVLDIVAQGQDRQLFFGIASLDRSLGNYHIDKPIVLQNSNVRVLLRARGK